MGGTLAGIGTGMGGTLAGIGVGAVVGIERGNMLVNNRINNAKRDETIKAIKSSFKECIENISGEIINEYKKKFVNYELLKGEDLSNLIESIEKK